MQHPVACLAVNTATDEFRLRRVNTMTKKYQASCSCGFKSKEFTDLDTAISALDKHKHKTEITEWSQVSIGSWSGKVVA